MRRTLATVVGLVLAAAAGCGGGHERPAAVATTGAPAGTVVEVEGEVTASRAGQARPLAVGDRVHDDDVIATAGGRVAIQLDKNHVVWRLGPRLTQQVAQSTAWSAPMASGDTVATTGEHSAAAGRHAEREAADTSASAVAPSAAAPTAPPAPAQAAAEPPKPVKDEEVAAGRREATTVAPPDDVAAAAAPAPPPPPARGDDGLDRVATGGGGGGSGGGGDLGGGGAPGGTDTGPGAGAGGADGAKGVAPDTNVAALDQAATDAQIEERALKVAPPSTGARAPVYQPRHALIVGDITTRGALTGDVVRDQVAGARAALQACATTAAPRGYTLSFTVGTTGKVSGVTVKPAAAGLKQCLTSVIGGWTFASTRSRTTVRVTLAVR